MRPEYMKYSCELAITMLCSVALTCVLIAGVKACLQSRIREREEKYEICGGPRRGRLNQDQLVAIFF